MTTDPKAIAAMRARIEGELADAQKEGATRAERRREQRAERRLRALSALARWT